jgi:hypothetical protein
VAAMRKRQFSEPLVEKICFERVLERTWGH